MLTDPILEEIHRHRQELMERFNYDFDAFCAYIKEQENVSQNLVVQPPDPKSPPSPSLQRTRDARR